MASKKIRSIESAAAEHIEEAAEVLEVDPRQTDLRASATGEQLDDPRSIELSEPFVTRWTVLVSTTNWEKGAIICAWRKELEAQDAPISSYSDEAWGRRVGGVTSQHVGRLRRVYQRFGTSHSTYPKLYWTHFLAALDWDDAEMWLEGAAQSQWSVSQMRQTRWQSMGGDPQSQPIEDEIVSASIDEDFSPSADTMVKEKPADNDREIPTGPRYDEPDFGEESDATAAIADTDGDDELPWEETSEPGEIVSPFASLPALPVDVADALEQFKLAIIRHRSSEWAEISREDMVQTLDALRIFAMQ